MTWTAYNDAGVDYVPLGYKNSDPNKIVTAAYQAEYCAKNYTKIAEEDLQPGDVMFWRKNGYDNGLYDNIHHVAIYVGEGYLIEASSSKNEIKLSTTYSNDTWEYMYAYRPWS